MSEEPSTIDAATQAARPTRAGRSTSGAAGGAKRIIRIPKPKKPGPRKGKYNAKGQHVDGIWFASQAEALRYQQLLALQEAGVIDQLRLQVKFPVTLNSVHICNYLADFRYNVIDELGRTLREVVEDVKGMMTDLYRLKRKLVEAQHGITIAEIPAKEIGKWADRIP